MATSISLISAALNALAQAGVVTDDATQVIATIPAGTGTINVSFDKDKSYTLQQVHRELLLALHAAVGASSTTQEAESSTEHKVQTLNAEEPDKHETTEK